MRLAPVAACALFAACSAGPRRPFPFGLVGPVSPRVAAEAARLGLSVAQDVPPGAETVPAGMFGREDAPEAIAPLAALRRRAARAVVDGRGVFFRLPAVPAGRDPLDYPEEWAAFSEAARELAALRPVLERGRPAGAPFPAPPGVALRAWAYGSRAYVLLVNGGTEPARFDPAVLAPWRALFEARADPRQSLETCAGAPCLAPEGVLWLESRPWPGVGKTPVTMNQESAASAGGRP